MDGTDDAWTPIIFTFGRICLMAEATPEARPPPPTYPVSNDLALQIWELEQEERGAGLEKYLEALPRNYYGMMDTAEAVGLDNPLAPGRIAKIAADLRENLGITGSGFSAQIGSHKAA